MKIRSLGSRSMLGWRALREQIQHEIGDVAKPAVIDECRERLDLPSRIDLAHHLHDLRQVEMIVAGDIIDFLRDRRDAGKRVWITPPQRAPSDPNAF